MSNNKVTFTVIGMYEYDGHVFAQHIDATDPHQAMALASIERPADLIIIGAILGQHWLIPSAEDSGKAAWASDLA